MDFKYPYTDFHELNLDWFLARFKEYYEHITEQDQKITTMEQTVEQFTTFVTNYFDNLDVQQEINNKLDAMAASGELQAMLQPYFDQFVESVDNQINTQNGRITTLEARMDTFASLTEGSTTGDAELQDIRVAYNGATYPTAGDAVRGQAKSIADTLGMTDDIPFNMSSPYISYLSGTRGGPNGIGPNANYGCMVFTAARRGTLKFVSKTSSIFNVYIYSGEPSSSTVYAANLTEANFPYNVPAGYIVAVNKDNSSSTDVNMTFNGFEDVIMSEDLHVNDAQVSEISTKMQTVTSGVIENYYVNATTGTILPQNPSSSTKYWITDYIQCRRCNKIIFYASYNGSNIGYAFFSHDKRVVGYGVNTGNLYARMEITVPESACYFVNTILTKPSDTIDSAKMVITYDRYIGRSDAESVNPININAKDGGYTALLRKIGFIGDSLMSGCSYYDAGGGTYIGGDNFDWAWGSFLSRTIGAEPHFFSAGGLTTHSWWGRYYNNTAFTDNLCQAYYIGLGVNDEAVATHVDIGTTADIDLSDFTQNADTYYGNYAKIIQYIHSMAPKAKIFVITNPKKNDEYNDAVRYMPTIFDNVYLIDLWEYGKQFYSNAHLGPTMWLNGHLTITGYREAAYHIGSYTSYIIENDMSDFHDLPYVLS